MLQFKDINFSLNAVNLKALNRLFEECATIIILLIIFFEFGNFYIQKIS